MRSEGNRICHVLVFLAILFSGCETGEPKTTLSVNISANPSGGRQVSSVTVRFQGNLDYTAPKGIFAPKGKPETISAKVEWWWENAYGSGDEIVMSENVQFSSEGSSSHTTTYSASAGYILLNYYWVEISWTDDDGSHSVQSSKAMCEPLSLVRDRGQLNQANAWIQEGPLH